MIAVAGALLFSGAGWLAAASTPAAAPDVLVRAAPGRQAVTIRGLTIEVPDSWRIDAQVCGIPQADTVLRPRDETAACLVRTDTSGMTWVDFNRPPSAADDLPAGWTTSDFPLGARTARLRWSPPGHQPVVARLDLPARGITMTVTAPADADVRAILTTARLTATDNHGCPAWTPEVTTFPARPAGALVPPGPASIRICRDVGGGIEQSMIVTGPPARQLADELDQLTPGTYDATPSGAACTDGGRTATFRLRLDYPAGVRRTVTARIGRCGIVGVTDGISSGRVTRPFIGTLFPLVGGAAMVGAGLVDQRSSG